MGIKLYMVNGSPPVRSVQIVAKALNINLELIPVDLMNGEQKSEAFIKMNPQHTVPTLDDNGFIIWDSHAILPYLAAKYGKNDSLYPKDLTKRAVVDQRLHFNSNVLSIRQAAITRPMFLEKKKTIDPKALESLNEAYGFLDKFLEGNQWIAGNTVTIADYCLISTVSSINILVSIDPKKYPRLTAWMKKVEALPEYQVSKEGLEVFAGFFKSILA